MLNELRIVNLGVIADATIELSSGMTVVSGETGAGKTMVVNGLGLLLGERADAGLVRHETTKALVEGRFFAVGDLAEQLAEIGGDTDGDELLTSRAVQASGRSRAMFGGVQVPIGRLAALLGEVATIHGQADQIRLGSPERQREVVDAYGGSELAHALTEYREVFKTRSQIRFERDELIRSAQERNREMDLLTFGVDEITQADPQPGEDIQLREEAARLQALDELRTLSARADEALSGSSDTDVDSLGAAGLVGEARKAIDKVAQLDVKATAVLSALQEASALVDDVAAQVASYLADLEADPVRLEAIASRLAVLQQLTRKYGSTVDEVLQWRAESQARLSELTGSDERIAELSQRLEELEDEVSTRASHLSALRQTSADDLAEKIHAELVELAMPQARVSFALHPLNEPGPWGAESVQLLLSANPGTQPGPLAKVASGGELSRIRLAIEVVLADTASGHTFVFDEVDAGVGGTVAIEVGRRLARLARTAQVIVVTHLAQVAAFADRHYVVTKSDDSKVTTSDLREVSGDARLAELARMMGGLAGDAGFDHARELLMQARVEFSPH